MRKPCAECDHYPCDHTGCDCDGTFHTPGEHCPRQDTGPLPAFTVGFHDDDTGGIR